MGKFEQGTGSLQLIRYAAGMKLLIPCNGDLIVGKGKYNSSVLERKWLR